MNMLFNCKYFCLSFLIILTTIKINAQNNFKHTSDEISQIKTLKAKVEAHPSDLEVHRAFIDAFDINDPALQSQYQMWINQTSKNFFIPFAIGQAYSKHENPKAVPFLIQASILNPDNAEVWYLLAGDAYLKNNLKLRQQYLKKAIQCAPANSDYALNFASSFEDINPSVRDSLYLDVAKRFPNTNNGELALYLLASGSSSKKIIYYQQLYDDKAKHHSSLYSSLMTQYFDLLLNTNSEQASKVGNKMLVEDKLFQDVWKER